MYRSGDVQRIDPVNAIRARPGTYLPAGGYDPVHLASSLVDEVLRRGISAVRVDLGPQWCVVTAEADWLAGLSGDPFERIVPFPEAGPNGMYVETILVAFARGVATTSAAGSRVVVGEPLGPLAGVDVGSGRAVAFSTRSTTAPRSP
ncbi:hypothetical protein L6E12_03920 [Actinokineospora sp. PR83]|uniref:hypothetical protein n=1 Tax=Actinokineospora sp. PR83 TaxID=2884908 RepID=UPI001F27B94C|nr:hypothetical protein [Actinokineospora sp. PR83]MCG8914936.1 hypothetical protein [Actinokineospora sp. PR83]